MNDVMEKRLGSFPSMGERGILEVSLNNLRDARLVEPCRHGCNKLLEFWITFEFIQTLVLVTKMTGLCVNEDGWSIPLSPFDRVANSRHRLRWAHILVTQFCDTQNAQTTLSCEPEDIYLE